MLFVSIFGPASRPNDGYVPPQGVLSPTRAPTKLHERIDLDGLPIQAISSGLYLDIIIAQRFTDQDLFIFQNLLSCYQSLPTWIAIYDEIAMRLAGRPLFSDLPKSVANDSKEISHDDFTSYCVSRFSHDTSLIIPMLHFFYYLHTKFGRKSMS